MKLYGGIYYDQSGISTSIRGMHLQTCIIDGINSNINGFNKVGYQKEVPVISSFAEYIGANGLSTVVDDKVGRISRTRNPLDFALAEIGYFQYKTADGIKMTRDGRFKIDKSGNLTTLEGYKVLGSNGKTIKFSSMPEKTEDISVDSNGSIKFYDKKSNKIKDIGSLSIVSSKGTVAEKIDVKQGFAEDSNVSLHEEFFNIIPARRNFEANRQLYIIQNDELSKTIQELGRA